MVRWGNSLDPDRQNVFFVSSNDGRFLFLQGVTKPIIDDTNYSAFIGVPPDLECLRDLPIKRMAYKGLQTARDLRDKLHAWRTPEE